MNRGGRDGDGKLLFLQKKIDEAAERLQAGIDTLGGQVRGILQQLQQLGGQFSSIDYTALLNLPKINNVTLSGNKSLADLGITIPSVPTIGYLEDASARDFTLTSGGYYRLSIPSGLPGGAMIFAITIITWTSATGAFNPVPYGDGTDAYLVGEANTVINGLKCRYWYIK